MKMKRYMHVALVIIILAAVVWVFACPFRISGDCMEPAVKDGQLCFLNRVLPSIRQYKIDDIILFTHEEKVWISRIVALENNTIQIFNESIIVNGAVLPDAKIHRNWSNWKQGTYAIDKPLQIPLDHVFVLSDNLPADHDDSRVFGPISKKSILGIIW